MREDLAAAFALLPSIPQDQYNGVARFLEAKGLVKEALDIATDPDFKFDLAIQLGDLETAQDIAGGFGVVLAHRVGVVLLHGVGVVLLHAPP